MIWHQVVIDTGEINPSVPRSSAGSLTMKVNIRGQLVVITSTSRPRIGPAHDHDTLLTNNTNGLYTVCTQNHQCNSEIEKGEMIDSNAGRSNLGVFVSETISQGILLFSSVNEKVSGNSNLMPRGMQITTFNNNNRTTTQLYNVLLLYSVSEQRIILHPAS